MKGNFIGGFIEVVRVFIWLGFLFFFDLKVGMDSYYIYWLFYCLLVFGYVISMKDGFSYYGFESL